MRVLVALSLVVVSVALCTASAVWARPSAGMPPGGAVRVFATQPNGPAGTIVITGAIGDYGKTLQMSKNGKPNPNGNYVEMTLKKGTFEVNATTLNAKIAKAPGTFSKATCSFSATESAPVTLFNGTGLYKGISGTLNVTLNFAGIGPRYTSGTHKGQCIKSNSAKLLAQYGSVIGTGTVEFG